MGDIEKERESPREREKERERDRETDRETEKETERERQRDTDRERNRDRHSYRETERKRLELKKLSFLSNAPEHLLAISWLFRAQSASTGESKCHCGAC